MSSSVVKSAEISRALSKLSKEQRKALLKVADKKTIEAICECVVNTLKGNVPLKSCEKNKLKKHKRILRSLGLTKSSWHAKKKKIIQNGGAFLPALLAPLLGDVLGSIFN
jgi:hypothetical protein